MSLEHSDGASRSFPSLWSNRTQRLLSPVATYIIPPRATILLHSVMGPIAPRFPKGFPRAVSSIGERDCRSWFSLLLLLLLLAPHIPNDDTLITRGEESRVRLIGTLFEKDRTHIPSDCRCMSRIRAVVLLLLGLRAPRRPWSKVCTLPSSPPTTYFRTGSW